MNGPIGSLRSLRHNNFTLIDFMTVKPCGIDDTPSKFNNCPLNDLKDY